MLPGGPEAAYMGAMPMQHLAVLVAALSFASSALAQPDAAGDYPNHPVRIIVSTSAGGGVDTVTRIIAAQLQEKLGQPFVVEDRGGGGGNIGAEAVYTATPDGYTLLASSLRRSPATSRSTRSSISTLSSWNRWRSCRRFPTCCWSARISR